MKKSASCPAKGPKIKIYSFLNDVVFKWIFGPSTCLAGSGTESVLNRLLSPRPVPEPVEGRFLSKRGS